MKVLITGGAGFIGHEVIRTILAQTDWEVISLDRLDTSGTLDRIAEILEENSGWRRRINIVWHDLKAPINDHVAHLIGNIDFIFHIAAASHVDRSIVDPRSFVMDNVLGTVNILEYARKKNKHTLRSFFYFSTDEVFGPAPKGISYKEDDRFDCTNPYAATKAGGEVLAKSFFKTYGLPVLVTHTMNVFGKRQHPEKFIPRVIRNVIEGKLTTIHADPTKSIPGSRFYISSADVAESLLYLVEYGVIGESYNIVGRKEINNLELAQIVASTVGKELVYELVDFHSARPGHDLRYALSGEKMSNLGWQASENVNRQIIETVEWTLENTQWLY